MHGMINRAFQGFLVATYGESVWAEVCSQAQLPFLEFEAMLQYDDALTLRCFDAAVNILHQPENTLLEDLGTHLITYPGLDPLRRLLRFGGATFPEFLLSLEELRDRGRLVLPEVELPSIKVARRDENTFHIGSIWKLPGSAPILLGTLRAMADDYGALAMLSLSGIRNGVETLTVVLHDEQYARDRGLALGEVG